MSRKRGVGAVAGRVLVAEDQDDMRSMLEICLRSEGHDVITARDGLEALEIARREAPDILITNLEMPRLDGLGLMRRLRGELHLNDIPVIVLSGASCPSSETIVSEGAYAFLDKPVDLSLLSKCVKLALDGVSY